MPVNKAARFRFDILDDCLRNDKKKWSKAALLRQVNRRLERHYGENTAISASQLRYDLESLQTEFGAPIEMYRDGKSYYYRSQQILQQDEDGSLRISLQVYVNHKLTSLLLSYGNNVKILQPASLAAALADIARAMVEQYSSADS